MKIIEAELLGNELRKMQNVKGIVGLSIARNLRMIDEELKEYYDAKAELFNKYGEEKDGKMFINTLTDNYKKYLEEITPYEQQEVEFSFRKVKEEDIVNSELTSEQMYSILDYMVE